MIAVNVKEPIYHAVACMKDSNNLGFNEIRITGVDNYQLSYLATIRLGSCSWGELVDQLQAVCVSKYFLHCDDFYI